MSVEPLEDRRLLAVDLQLVGDFNLQPTSALPVSFLPTLVNTSNITPVGDAVYFTASDFDHGNELWHSDGTPEGTYLVKDIVPGPTWSTFRHFEAVGDMLYFQAISPATGTSELWKSDGTEAGTMVVRAHNAGGPAMPYNLTNVDGTLYFIGFSIGHGRELWKSDGTPEGTVLVKDIVPGFGDAFADFNISPISSATPLPYFTAVGDTLYFIATTQTFYQSGRELWKSDGTPEGTVVVKDIRSGPGSTGTFDFNFVDPQLTAVGDTLYFVADDFINGAELWKTDGSEAGTVIVKNITSGPASTFNGTSHKLVDFDGALYFTRVSVGITQLWTSDGLSDGTVQITQFQANTNELTVAGDRMFFGASGPGGLLGLWTSDGTGQGTVHLRTFTTPIFSATLGLVASGNAVYFAARDVGSDYEVWKSDGTPGGTGVLRDIYPGGRSSNPVNLADAGGTLFFAADDGAHGYELWATDGTFATTRLVKDIRDGTASFSPLDSGYAELNGVLLFAGNNGVTGRELWRTDGTAAGTQLVADLRTGSQNSSPMFFKRFGAFVYFVADSGSGRSELWRTDGTSAGITHIADISTAPGLDPFFTELNGALYLRGQIGDHGTELLRIDATGAGPTLVKDINPGEGSATLNKLTAAGGKLFFAASEASVDQEPWVSDGTEAGTMLLKDIRPGDQPSFITEAVAVGDLFYFTADDDGVDGVDLWRSDGTPEGTVKVADLRTDGDSEIAELTNVDGTLYFRGNDGVTGRQVWKLAPGAPAPQLLKEIGDGTFTPGHFANVDGTLFFTAVDEEHGRELWTSDGTAEGTVLVKDTIDGPISPGNFTVLASIDGTLYFSINDYVHGQELWTSEGTPAGTQMVADLAPGLASSSPVVTRLGSRLLVQATTGPYGAELWSATLTPTQEGDYDFDNDVDGHDFLAWQRNLGAEVTPAGSGADGDDSGTIDAGDLGVWAGNFGMQPAAAAASAAASFSEEQSAGFGETGPRGRVSPKLDGDSGIAGHQRAADAVFAAGDFTRLFAANAANDDYAPRRSYRPRVWR